MNGVELEESKEEKDLGVIVTNKLSVSAQCAKAAKTANTVLGQISRAFHFRDKDIFSGLYKQYVRPHLEYAVQAWSPWLEKDKEILESVQKRAARSVSGTSPGLPGPSEGAGLGLPDGEAAKSRHGPDERDHD